MQQRMFIGLSISLILVMMISLLSLCSADTANIVTIGGGGNCPATTEKSHICNPSELDIDIDGNMIYVLDEADKAIRIISQSTNKVSTINMSGVVNSPRDIFLHPFDNHLYVTDFHGQSIFKISLQTNNISVAHSFSSYSPTHIAFNHIDKKIYGSIASAKLIYSLFPYNPILESTSMTPDMLAFNSTSGDLFIADNDNNCIWKLDALNKNLTVFASSITASAIVYDSFRNLIYYSDTQTNSVRSINTTGHVSIVAQPLSGPTGLSVDRQGNLYVAERTGNRISKIIFCSIRESFNNSTWACDCISGYHRENNNKNKNCIVIPNKVDVETFTQISIIIIVVCLMFWVVLTFLIHKYYRRKCLKPHHKEYNTSKTTIKAVNSGSADRVNGTQSSDQPNALTAVSATVIQSSSSLGHPESQKSTEINQSAIKQPFRSRLASSLFSSFSRKSSNGTHKSVTTSLNSLRRSSATLKAKAGLSMPGFLAYQVGVDFVCEKPLEKGGCGIVHLGKAINPDIIRNGIEAIVVKEYTNTNLHGIHEVFQQEIAIMYLLRDHPNIAGLLGFTERPLAILMKYYSNGSLLKYIKTPKTVKTKRMLLRFARNIAKGVECMHANGIAHCDLKPANVLLDVDPKSNEQLVCVLTDFGLSRPVDDTSLNVKNFRTVHVNGASVFYASPESIYRLRKNNLKNMDYPYEYDPKTSDCYAMGVILCFMVCRLPLWRPEAVRQPLKRLKTDTDNGTIQDRKERRE